MFEKPLLITLGMFIGALVVAFVMTREFKEKPLAPEWYSDNYLIKRKSPHCPFCHTRLVDTNKYCPSCGCAIDWEGRNRDDKQRETGR